MSLSRTAVARFLKEQPAQQRARRIRQAAAWLIATGQSRRSGELISEVARLEAEDGYLWVRLTSARPLSPAVLSEIETFLKAQTKATRLEVETVVVPDLIGGIRIETAEQVLDATIDAKLRRLTLEAAL